jgi:hypothetical protein
MKNSVNLKIMVCVHKPDFYESDGVYMPLHVGKALSQYDLKIQGDDIGENISDKNRNYCELTGLYWAWKNLEHVDYIGLCHYRRYFDFNKAGSCPVRSVSKEEYLSKRQYNSINNSILDKYDIILATPKSYPYNLFIDYSLEHISEDMRVLKDVIHALTPEYDFAFNETMLNNNKLSHFNMFICRWEIFNGYCEWLFLILGEVEKRVDISNYSTLQARIYGYMSERLLNVYVEHHKFRKKYYPIMWINDMEKKRSFYYRIYENFHFIYRVQRKISFVLSNMWNTSVKNILGSTKS